MGIPALGPPKLRVIINHMGTPTLQVGQCHIVRRQYRRLTES